MRFLDWIWECSWQAAVLALFILAAQLLCGKRMSPNWRCGLWLLLLAPLLLPSLPPSPTSIFNLGRGRNSDFEIASRVFAGSPALPRNISSQQSETGVSSRAATAFQSVPGNSAPEPKPGSRPSAPFRWKRLAFSLWFAGLCYFVLRLIWTNVRFARAIRSARRLADPTLLAALDSCRAALQIKTPILLLETTRVETPCVYGFHQKQILLPAGFAARFSAAELRHIFMHELAHVRRRDLELNWLAAVLQAMHWFNPLLWFAFARMRADRELATDALALEHSGTAGERSNEAYGETILKVLAGFTRQSDLPQLVGILESKSGIERRLRAIARCGMTRPYAGLSFALACALACLTLTSAVQQKPAPGAAHDIRKATARNAPPFIERSQAAQAPNGQRRFSLEIVDFDTGAPIEGVTLQIEMEDYAGNSVAKTIRTGTDGNASIELPADGLKRFSYRAEHAEYVTLNATWFDQQTAVIPAASKLKMRKGMEIGGVAADQAGIPVGGAEIYFDTTESLMLDSFCGVHAVYRRNAGQLIATSDASGRWIARGLWPGWAWAQLRVRHANYADELFLADLAESKQPQHPGQWIDWKSLVNKTAVLKLEAGISFEGQVLDPSARGVPGARVEYADQKAPESWQEASMGSIGLLTDSDGRFQIAHLPRKHIYFTALASGYAPEMAELNAASETNGLEIHLKRGLPFNGVVKDLQGAPVPGVKVRFINWSIWQGVKWETVTDSEGKFSWEHAPETKFSILLTKEGYIQSQKIVQGGEERDLRLTPVLRLHGQVLDASTKEKIRSFRMIGSDQEVGRNGANTVVFGGSSDVRLTGTNGAYLVDLGRLYASGYSDGYFGRFSLRIEADGYEPLKSKMFLWNSDNGDVQFDFALKPNRLVGTLVDSSGAPVAGAQVALDSGTGRPRLAGKPRFESLDNIQFPESSADGTFMVGRDPDATHLIAVHEKGFALVEMKALTNGATIKLQPWARVEGVVRKYGVPLPNERLSLSSPPLGRFPQILPLVNLLTTTDSQGRYTFSYVPPGKVSISRIPRLDDASNAAAEQAEAAPGETKVVNLGGTGRPLLGRFKIQKADGEIDLSRAECRLMTVRPKPPESVNTPEQLQAWLKQERIARALIQAKYYVVRVSASGAFRIDEVLPGKYELSLNLLDPRDPAAMAFGKYVAEFRTELEVPASDISDHAPLELGEFQVALKGALGRRPAADFTARDLSGKPVKLSDFRGKYVLLDFWATWCAPCIGELPYLRKAQERFGERKDFVIVAVSLDTTIRDLQRFADKNNLPGRQLFLPDPLRGEMEREYDYRGIPAKFLVAPDGRIIEDQLEGVELVSKLETLLK